MSGIIVTNVISLLKLVFCKQINIIINTYKFNVEINCGESYIKNV